MQPFDPLAVDLSCVNLIEASAGTGKTHSIATLFVRLLLEQALRIDQILVVTYTRAATAELRDRLRTRLRRVREGLLGGDLGDDASLRFYVQQRLELGLGARDTRLLDDALRSFDTAAIHTIHGFCQRVLQENAFESGARFDARLQEDDALLDALVHEHWAQRLYASEPMFVGYLRDCGTDLASLRDLARLASTHRDARVLPATAAEPLGPAIGAWRQAREAARALWQAQAPEILERLSQPGVLHGTFYPAKAVRAGWGPWLDHALATDRLQGLVDDERDTILQRCTPAVLQRRANAKFKANPPQHPFFEACQALVEHSRALQTALERNRLALLRELTERVRDELPPRKEAQGRWAFDDLVYQLRSALRRPGSALAARIRERYRVALIDEFQDTDPVQYEVFRTVWAGHDGLFLIGDPKQAIYSFRGADVFAYLQAVQHAQARATLRTNHRSDQGLVQAVNALFGRAAQPFVLEHIPFVEVQARHGRRVHGPAGATAPFELQVVQPEGDKPIPKGKALHGLAHSLAADMVALLASGVEVDDERGSPRPLRPGQLAVLCRTNRQAQAVQDALRLAGLPSVLQSGASVFDTAEAADLERLLRALAEPGDLRAVRSALATRILGVNATRLLSMSEDPAVWTAQVERLLELAELWRRRGVLACTRGILDAYGVMERWLGEVGGERRLTNLLHLAELVQRAAADRHLGPQALVQWLHRMRHDEAARADEVGDSAMLRLESDAEAVQLVTVHRSKGLQYDVVYAPFLWDGTLLRRSASWWLYHDARAQAQLTIDLDLRGEGRGQAEVEALAESLRVLYVALTRARHLCRCVWGVFNDAGTSALAYLLQGEPTASAAAWIAAGSERTKALAVEPGLLQAPLDALVAAAEGAVALRPVALGTRASYRPRDGQPAPALAPAVLSREPSRGYSLSSYSSLIAAHERQPRVEEEADRDHGPLPTTDDAPSTRGARIALHGVGGGASIGRVVHALLEHSDLSTVSVDSLRSALEQQLGADATLDPASRDRLALALLRMLERPLDAVAPGFSLRHVTPTQSLVELPFQLAVTPAVFTSPRATTGVTGEALARLFLERASHPTSARYGAQLASAPLPAPAGFLSGFIDLVFVQQGRWFVVDYKTNFLGPLVDDYAPARLEQAMLHHHYVLQYHLYAAAVDRYLRWRQQCGQPELLDYDYERHFGGVLYLFVRGMCEGAPAGSGVFFDRPPAALIRGLQELLEHGSEGAP